MLPTVDPDRPEPLYSQLAAILREQIRTAELRGRVPSVKTLQQQYGVAQGTAERALTILREEGLIVSVQGRGHFVAEQPEEERRPGLDRLMPGPDQRGS